MSDDLLGTWRQIRPDPQPAVITVTFERDGTLRYALDEQTFALRWRVEGERLITTRDGVESASTFRFASRTMLVVESDPERRRPVGWRGDVPSPSTVYRRV